jgi:hypothetical protein
MAALDFVTVPDELLGVAAAAMSWLKSLGYAVTPERHETGYPFTPTLYGKKQATTVFIEVDGDVALERVREWAAYGCSRQSDTRVWWAIPGSAKRTGEQDLRLNELGIGLLLVKDGKATVIIPGKDLALNVKLPEIERLPRRVQRALGPAYEHFDRGEWRECFQEACLVLEQEARKYLWKGVRAGRIVIASAKGEQEKLTKEKIDRFTMGELADRFERIVQQAHTDRVVGDALKQVNPNRVGVVHHKHKAAPEAKLRRDVGSQMWLIIGALKDIYEAP